MLSFEWSHVRDSSTELILRARSLLAAILVVLICDFTLHCIRVLKPESGLRVPSSYSEVIKDPVELL